MSMFVHVMRLLGRRALFAVPLSALLVIACNETELRPDVPLPRGNGPALYNYKFHQDASSGVPDSLVEGAEANVEFFIGPKQDPRGKASIKEPLSQKLEALLGSHADTDILVRMTCWVCDDTPVDTKVIHYLTSSHASTSASFGFTPNGTLGAKTDKRITFDITIGGAYVESVQAAFGIRKVGANGAAGPTMPTSKPTDAAATAAAISRKFRSADLEITVSQVHGNIALTFYTQNAALRASLASKGLSQATLKNPVKYDTGVAPASVYALSAYFYCQSTYWFHDAGEATPTTANCAPPGAALTSVGDKFSRQDGDRVLKFIGKHGWTLFDTLFKPSQGDNVALTYINALNEVAATSDHRLLIDIVSPNVYLPWPMFISSSAESDLANIENYWGAKFQISDRPGAGTSYPRNLEQVTSSQEMEFATFKDDPPPVPNSIGDRGSQLANTMLGLIHVSSSPQVARSKAEMLQAMDDRRNQLKLIVAHMHGEVGATESPERLIFHSDDFVDATDLYIETGVMAGGKLLLVKRPFVILNGCETGAVGYAMPTDSSSFVRTFLARGASGVVATEARVLQGSMYWFADSLLKRLMNGEEAAAAVTETRLYMYYGADRSNPATWPRDPIGLFYSYHGLPDVSFPQVTDSTTAKLN